ALRRPRASAADSGRGRAGALLHRVARRADARRNALRHRPYLPIRRGRTVARVLARLAARYPHAVPRRPRTRRDAVADTGRRRLPLPLAAAVPAHVRAHLHVVEPRVRGDVPRLHRRREAARINERADRPPHRRLRVELAHRVGRFAVDPEAHVDARDRHRLALAAGGDDRLRDRSEHLRAARERASDGGVLPERERGRDRLPRRGHTRPAHRPREQRRADDRVVRRAARPAHGGPAPRRDIAADDGRRLHRAPRRARRLLVRLAVDPPRAEPRRAEEARSYGASRSRTSRLTTFGSALPCVSFITWPTKKPSSPSLPPR